MPRAPPWSGPKRTRGKRSRERRPAFRRGRAARHPPGDNMIHLMEAGLRRVRQALSRSEWSLRLLRLPRSTSAETEHGLVMIQIDGLSRAQLEKALRRGQMPFL